MLVARWRASPNSSSDKSFSKILCSDVASHLFYADLEKYEFQNPLWRCGEPFDLTWFETYKLENCLWRGGEPVLALALTNHFQKSCVARWRAIQSCLTQKHINSKNLCSEVASHSIWADFKHINFKTTYSDVASRFKLAILQPLIFKNCLWRGSEPVLTIVWTFHFKNPL